MKLLKNKLFILLSMFVILNLACDSESPTQANPDADPSSYCLSMSSVVEGGEYDYVDDTATQRAITITLSSSETDCNADNLSPVSGVDLTFDWTILDGDGNEFVSGSAEPHLQTIPNSGQTATDIYLNQSYATDDSGEIEFYWIDDNQEGCIFLYCDYTHSDGTVWSLESPGDDCINSNNNPFEVKAAEASYENISIFTLISSIDTLTYNDLPNSVDSTESVTELNLDAIVKDADGVALQYIPVKFSNTTPNFGTLINSEIISNSSGLAQNQLVNIYPDNLVDGLGTITINAQVINENDEEIVSENKDILFVAKSLKKTWDVANLDAVFLQNISLINNINLSFSDSIIAQVLDENDTPVNGVPIQFSLVSDDVGYLENQLLYSDEQGFAKTVFHISQADLLETSDNIEIDINVFVSDDHNQTLERTYVINGNANIEYDVDQFNFYPQSISNLDSYASAGENIGEYEGVREVLPFIVKSEGGQGIEGVPVQFELFEQSRNSNGSLSTALTYTCCSSSSNDEGTSDDGGADGGGDDDSGSDDNSTNDGSNASGNTLYDWNGDGNATIDENMGIATVIYNNSVPGATDNIRAFILDPQNQTQYIDANGIMQGGFEEFSIQTKYADELAQSVLLNTIPSSLNFGDSSTTVTDDGGTGGGATAGGVDDTANQDNCAKVYAIAFNQYGGVLNGVPVNFSLNDISDAQYGILTEYYAVTDSIDVAPYIAAETSFCTFENTAINLEEDINIQINANLSNNDNITINPTNITLTQNSSSLGMVSNIEYTQLPNNSIETSTVSVTVTDNDGYVIENTLVQFESLAQDDNGELTQSIGSFDPTYSFTDVLGTASSIFNMGNDVGLATIITSVPEYNLSDTSYVSITASDAEYIQILQPYPNEITVSGGGGLESTELTVEVKDGNGNLVSEPYLIYFELGDNTPNGTFVNVEGQSYGCIESSNGTGSVTLNSGTQPGSIPVHVELFNLGIPEEPCASINGTPLDVQPDIGAELCASIYTNRNNGLYDECELAFFDAIPVTVVTGAPHSGEINFSYVDIAPIGGGLYQVPLSVQLEDEWANPVQDSTNVYIWVEGFARSFDNTTDYPNEGAITDTVKWGIEIDGSIDIRDSLRYVLQRPDQFSLGQNPNEMNSNIINNSCQCYKSQLLDECSSDGITTNCIWEVIPNEPGSVVGEAKTGMLSPDNAYVPGVAWSYVYFGTGDMFERVIIKALTYDSNGNILLIDSRVNHQNRPLTLPFWPGTVNVSSAIDAWDFGVQGAGSECYEPDWVNDGTLGDESGTTLTFPNEGVQIIASITDYYQYPVSGGTILLDADFSTPDEGSYNYCDVAEAEEDYDDCFVPVGTQASCSNTSATNIDDSDTSANAHDWIACDPIDSDGDGITGDCDIDDFDNQCSLCVGNGGLWTPDNDDGIPGSFDDNQTVCKTNGNGQCFWIIHYNENVIPRQENNGQFTYQDRISTIITTLQNPIQSASESIDIILEKNP
mgnify:CR=1 FL=1